MQAGEVVEEEGTVTAIALAGEVRIDGRLDEPAWAQGRVVDGFVQRDPIEGSEPTERTEAIVLYDDEALYVGARLYDSMPDSIVARLGRRDADLESDHFVVLLDPYFDRRSGYYFGLNAAGTLYDGVLLNDEWDDSDWDGVWQGRVHRTEDGWTAEIRIPYSQVRFHRQDQYVWGINFLRHISRKQERDYLVYTPRDESGFVSRFHKLVGMHGIQPRRQLEVIPYLTTRARYDETAGEGNPFNDGSLYDVDGGADVRLGITSDLTLNATINPDFGQVEVDPAVINLSDFETFFSEKRPFFVEGSSVFGTFGSGGSRDNWGFNWSNPRFFYSRRIGRAPAGGLTDHTFSHVPDGTRILGAAKVTGKVARSWNVGAVQALTAKEVALLQHDDRESRLEVEPVTYYGIARAQKEFADGRQGIGVLSTFNHRFFGDERLKDQMNERSMTAGVDGWTFLDPSKVWVVNGWAGVSHLQGTPQRLLDVQRSSTHYFQRPDVGHVSVDEGATTMTGWAGRVAMNKQQGRVIFNTALGTVSPSFNVNDMGFHRGSDIINGHLGVGYSWPDPGRYTRSAVLIGAVFRSLDYAGHTTWAGVWGLGRVEFLNYYRMNAIVAVNPETVVNTRRTRGGPLTLNPPGVQASLFVGSDSRKPLVLGLSLDTYQAEWTRDVSVEFDVEWSPVANLMLALSPSVSWSFSNSQWVGAFDDPHAVETFGKRYVFAEIDRFTWSSTIRANWTFTPELSFQLYAQPLFSIGDYERYKELLRPMSYDFVRYGEGATTFDPATLRADPDGPAGPAAPIDIPILDFNVVSLRGTAVLRWEYRPGSRLYFVWTQRRSESMSDPYFELGPSLDHLWSAPVENVFMIKMSWWFGP